MTTHLGFVAGMELLVLLGGLIILWIVVRILRRHHQAPSPAGEQRTSVLRIGVVTAMIVAILALGVFITWHLIAQEAQHRHKQQEAVKQPEAVVVSKKAEATHYGLLDFGLQITAVVRNGGAPGTVAVEAVVTQMEHRWTRQQSIELSFGEEKQVVFDFAEPEDPSKEGRKENYTYDVRITGTRAK